MSDTGVVDGDMGGGEVVDGDMGDGEVVDGDWETVTS